MKNVKNVLILSSLLMGSLAVSPSVLAESQTKATTPAVEQAKDKASKSKLSKEQHKANKKAITDKTNSQNDLLKEVDKGISEGFKKVLEATKLIEKDKEKEAIKALQEATGKFDIALAANPKLGFIPITSTTKLTELLTTPETIKAQVELAVDFLKDSKVQAARAVLSPLQDDLVTSTTSLPMTTYPDAIKLATKMLVEGKKDAALATLSTALSTFVEEVSVIPLSLLRVEAMVGAASELDKEKEKDKALILLSAAEKQLQVATALGYTTKHSLLFEALSEQIKAVKKEVTGGNVVEKLYNKLKTSIKSLIGKKSEQTTSK